MGGEVALGLRRVEMTLWDLTTPEAARERVNDSVNVTAAAFDPSGTSLALVANRDAMTVVTLWDVARGKALGEPWPGERSVSSLTFSPDGR